MWPTAETEHKNKIQQRQLLTLHELYAFLFSCRFLRSVGAVEHVSARKFLEAASLTKDDLIFYTVFKFFQQRNVRLRGNPRFASGQLHSVSDFGQRIPCNVHGQQSVTDLLHTVEFWILPSDRPLHATIPILQPLNLSPDFLPFNYMRNIFSEQPPLI